MNTGALDWEDLRALLAVLETGSLSAAARQLGVTQPTMRRRLDALEAAIGAGLFTRSPGGLAPTGLARHLRVHAEAMATAAAALARAASAGSEADRGVVRVTASDVIGAEVLPGLLATLRHAHPALEIELDLSNRSKDLLRQEADIAVRMTRPAQAALVARRVGVARLGLFAHPDYVARNGLPDSLAALRGFDLIGPDRESADLQAIAASGLPTGFTLRTDSQLAQLAAIRAGLGIGICQVALARRPPLVPVLPALFAPGLETWIVMHEDLRRVHRVRLVFDHLVAGMTGYLAGQ
jgi:DNA-binding transcriptional LysR family regulator